MKEIKLACGYEGMIDERVTDDFGLLWELRKADRGELGSIFNVLNKVFGDDENIESLMECLKEEDGIVPNEKLVDAILEALNSVGDDGKN